MQQWQNWSGNQRHSARFIERPESVEQLVRMLQHAEDEALCVRAIGSSHSFVPFWTDDMLISLDGMKGLVDHDPDNLQATFRAGAKIHEMGEPLWQLGMSMQTMGDIDRQSLAGAISTGTHGTGATLKNMSSQVIGIELVDAKGSVDWYDRDKDMDVFRALQVSLGTLGIITKVRLQLMAAYHLHERNWIATVEECQEQLQQLISENRHWEFFWDPGSDRCAMKSLNIADREPGAAADNSSDKLKIGPSYKILPSTREMKFNEIEFCLPAQSGWECFLEIRSLMKRKYTRVRWPLEYRTLAADDILISGANQQDSVTISAHEGHENPYHDFFAELEAVFSSYGGRPHWGKIHTHDHAKLSDLYPNWQDFTAIRSQMDPAGRFLNPFLERMMVS